MADSQVRPIPDIWVAGANVCDIAAKEKKGHKDATIAAGRAFSSRAGRPKAGGELERNSLPEDVDTNIYNLFHFRWVRRKAGGELSGN